MINFIKRMLMSNTGVSLNRCIGCILIIFFMIISIFGLFMDKITIEKLNLVILYTTIICLTTLGFKGFEKLITIWKK